MLSVASATNLAPSMVSASPFNTTQDPRLTFIPNGEPRQYGAGKGPSGVNFYVPVNVKAAPLTSAFL